MKRFKAQQACLIFMMLILSVFFITGCGGHGGETDKWMSPPPEVISVVPLDVVTGAGPACINETFSATFNTAMNASTITAPGTFTVKATVTGINVPGVVTYDDATMTATFTPTVNFTPSVNYTATISTAATDVTGNPLAAAKVWSFTVAATICAPSTASILGSAKTYGTFGGSAGMTNTGNQTVITGSGGNTADIGTISTANASITGFHEKAGALLTDDRYTDTLGADSGQVTGLIYTCTVSTTGPDDAVNLAPATDNAARCALATQARLDAQAAFIALAAMPSNGTLAGNLAGTTIHSGVWTNASSVMIQGGDLTLDAQGDADALFVFQIGTTLLVGGPGATAPQSVILINGAQAKNVFWQVGTTATINAAGGGTMEGTIIASSGVVFSTAANVNVVTLNGRALSLVASVTMVNTQINVPAP